MLTLTIFEVILIRRVLTEGPEGPLLGHQGEETRLQSVCDDDVKKLFKVLPVTSGERQSDAMRRTTAGPLPNAKIPHS